MAPHNYPCMLFSVTEHQVAALLAAVEHTLASPGRWSCQRRAALQPRHRPHQVWRVLTHRVSARAVNPWWRQVR